MEFNLNMNENDEIISLENSDSEDYPECSSNHEIADYGNDMFLKLRDCGFSATAKTNFDHKNMDSWDVYMRYVRYYDLIQLYRIKNQFTTNAIDVQLYTLCPNDIKALSEALVYNNLVTTFNLTGNELEITGCCYLSDLLRKNHVITHLELSQCKIDCQGAIELSRGLESSALKSLNLSYNKIEKAGLQSILESLQSSTHLKVLDISYNDIRGDCVRDIRMFIETNGSLEKLNLSGNFLNEGSDLSLLIGTSEVLNETLEVLILQSNGISGDICANIFKNLMIKSERLKILDLSRNSFRNIGEFLGQGIKKTTTLKELHISYNPITTDDIVNLLNNVVEPSSLSILGMTHVLVDERMEKAISSAKLRMPGFDVRVCLYTGIKTNPVDLKKLYLQRLHYLGVQKPKKKTNKVDIGHVLLKMKKEGILQPMKKDKFLEIFDKLKIKNSEGINEELAKAFSQKNKRIDVALMLDKYLELYPETTTLERT